MPVPIITGLLTTLAVAAGAASIPIIIHLLNRNRYRVVPWAAMRFLLAAQRKNTRRMRLEQWILLAVRVLVVVLLVLAMASVYGWANGPGGLWSWLFPDTFVRAAAGSQRTHKILVLDGSFSMAHKNGDRDAFERARHAAMQIIDDSPGGDGFSVVLMAAPPRRIVAEASDDPRKVAEEIQSLRLPHGNADLTATLNTVADLLRTSPGKFEEKEVYFLTDLQRSTWTAHQAVDPGMALQKIQSRARTIFVNVGEGETNNLAVTSVLLDVPMVTTGGVTPIVATLHNYSTEARRQAKIDLLVGKARAVAADPPFRFRVEQEILTDVPPGQTATVSFSFKFPSAGEYAVEVRAESDALELDDRRTVIVSVKDTVPVMLVNGKPAVELYERATEFLSDALNPFQGTAAPRNFPARPRIVSESNFADAGQGDLTPYDCVFLCDVPRLGQAEIKRLEAHLRRGGGVVICLGPRVDLEAYNRLLYRNGEGILPAKLVGRERAPDERFYTFYSDDEGYKKPPLTDFGADNGKTILQSVPFYEYVIAEVPASSKARKVLSFMPDAQVNRGIDTPRSPTKSGIAKSMRLEDPAILEWSRYRGRVILITTTVNQDWTDEWPKSPSFLPLVQELFRFAVAGRLREHSGTVGEVLEEYLPVGNAGLDVTIHTPDDKIENARTEDREDGSVFRWSGTDTSGVYRAVIGLDPRDHLFAINVPTTTDAQQACESDLARTNPEELRSTFPGWDFQVVTEVKDAVHSGGPLIEVSENTVGGLGMAVARALLLAMLVLLLAEVVLAWKFGHYSAVGMHSESPPQNARWVPTMVAGMAAATFLALAVILVSAAWTGDFLGFLPESFRRMVETALDISPPAPGEGTHWRLEFLPYLWSAAADPWLAGLMALGSAAMVIVIYLHEGRTTRPAYKLFLAGLRLCFILMTLAVFLPQIRLWFERQSWPDVAVIIDDSRSMSAADNYRDPRVAEAVERLAKIGNLTAPERLQLAQALLTQGSPNWLETLLNQRQVKVHIYHCSGRAQRLQDVTDAEDSEQLDAATTAVRELRAEGESSQLGAAVRQVLNDFRGSSLAAVIMLTDGVTTDGEDLPQVSRYAAQMGVPLYFVGIGDSHELRDLYLHDLQAEDSVYVNDRIVFEARLTGQGYADKTVNVTLKEKGSDKVLDSQLVRIDPQGKPVKFRLAHVPTKPGEKVYVLEVPPEPDESQTDNNKLERPVFVRDSKLIKLLYVEGSARYEYRFIKTLMERESALDASNKTIDLKVLLCDSDDEYASEDKSAIAGFPSKVELNQFDVVILGDVDPRNLTNDRDSKDRKLGEKNLQNLATFVRERGGGLLLIAGERFNPNSFKDTPLRDILPIELTGPPPAETDFVEGYHPEITAVGRFHPVFRFSPDEGENANIWNGLEEMFWWSEGYRAKPAAEVLAVHPRRSGEAGRAGRVNAPVTGAMTDPARQTDRPGDGRHPLVLQHFIGAGRCMFFGFDETWRWRYREKERYFNQFWIQTVRYLARSRIGRIDLKLDRQIPYRRGEPIKIMVRFPDDSPPPPPETEVKVVAERALPQKAPGVAKAAEKEIETQTLTLAKVEGSRATYETLLTQTPEGDYKFWLSSPTGADPKPKAECRVLSPPGEMDRLRMNQQDMERAAEETHGRFYTLADADRLLDELPVGTRVALTTRQPPRPLWNHLILLALALTLLSSEWFLRKRKHLL
ncbi:MAG TPA: VWA domain-containing protein [Gemmataceae bacterium]|jgi:hypothetical protein|nr:VWA domain-containing protein [Gemmataceae bacterium]